MDRKYKVGGYVKLAKLWERSKDVAVAYHSSYYAERFRDDVDKRLVGVYIDITGNKEIYKRPYRGRRRSVLHRQGQHLQSRTGRTAGASSGPKAPRLLRLLP